MKTLLISDEYPCFCEALERRGYRLIPTENIKTFLLPESRHADLQALVIKNKLFTLKECQSKVGKNYSENVRLNCLFFGNRLYGKLNAADASVLDFCRENGIETVNVRQGYTRCSTLILNDKAAVTADKSIAKALERNGAEVLLISAGHIRLEGFDYGFIGGASFSDRNTVFFFGDITKHPDYQKIAAFFKKYNSQFEILCRKEPLTDIGGAVLL